MLDAIAGEASKTMPGVVIDGARRAPISGATITVGRSHAVTTSGPDGSFALPCEKDVRGIVTAAGFVRASVTLACGRENTIALTPGVIVEGRVLGPNGPFAGATVSCGEGEWGYLSDQSTSNADGTFMLPGCRSGSISTRALADGHAAAFADLGEHGPGGTVRGVLLQLESGRLVEGVVKEADGAPVAAEMMLVEADDWRRVSARPTDEAGRFSIRVGNEKQHIGAAAKDGRTAFVVVDAGIAPIAQLELTLPEAARIHGRVVGDATDLEVVAFADRRASQSNAMTFRDRFWAAASRGSFVQRARIDGNEFIFDSIERGAFLVQAQSAAGKGEAKVDARETTTVTITLVPSARLAVTILREGQPAQGTAHVSSGDSRTSRPLRRGATTIPGLHVGDARIELVPSDGRPIPTPTTVRLAPGENVLTWNVRDDSFRVDGRIRDTTSAPVVGAEVSVASETKDWLGAGESFTLTDEAGAFSISAPDANTHLYIHHRGFASAAVRAGDATLIELRPGTPTAQVRKAK